MTRPATGSRKSSQPCASRVSVAQLSVSRNRAEDTPASNPTTPPSTAMRVVCHVASSIRARRAICHLLGGPAGGERLPTGPCDPSGRSHQPEGGYGELHRLEPQVSSRPQRRPTRGGTGQPVVVVVAARWVVVVATTTDTGSPAESTHCFAVLQPRSCTLDWVVPLQGISAIASSMLGPKPTVFSNA